MVFFALFVIFAITHDFNMKWEETIQFKSILPKISRINQNLNRIDVFHLIFTTFLPLKMVYHNLLPLT